MTISELPFKKNSPLGYTTDLKITQLQLLLFSIHLKTHKNGENDY